MTESEKMEYIQLIVDEFDCSKEMAGKHLTDPVVEDYLDHCLIEDMDLYNEIWPLLYDKLKANGYTMR